MTINNKITKKCFGFWAQCPSKIEDINYNTVRYCVHHYECFKEWRFLGGIMATEKEIELW